MTVRAVTWHEYSHMPRVHGVTPKAAIWQNAAAERYGNGRRYRDGKQRDKYRLHALPDTADRLIIKRWKVVDRYPPPPSFLHHSHLAATLTTRTREQQSAQYE